MLASLRLTVALLALSMVLIFIGTLVQVRMGVWEAMESYFRSPIAWVDAQMFIPESVAKVGFRFPLPGGAALGVGLLLNLIAAHLVRFRLNARRIGILLIHAGLIVLLAGEFATAWFADEGQMAIDEGRTVGFVEDVRSSELVVIDPSGRDTDRVVTVPGELVRRGADEGEVIEHSALPFKVQVVAWIENARLLRGAGPVRADQGVGLEAFADELPRARGVEGAQTDAPAAYVRLFRDDREIGTWLLWTNLIDAQRVEIDGEHYGLALRYRRVYLPYELKLLEFRHDRFVGTQIAKNFSSRLRLLDSERGVDREVLISMNNPLRYRGAAFYQASYKPDGSGTVLQVVRNPGAVLPYVACALVSAGLLLHFGIAMRSYLRRRDALERRDPVHSAEQTPRRLNQRVLMALVFGLGLVVACSALFRPGERVAYDIDRFETIPVTAGGRIKPMDTAARHALMVAGGLQSVENEAGGMSASRFLMGLIARPEEVADLPILRVDHPDVLALLDRSLEEGGRISLSAIEPYWERVVDQAGRALEVDAKRRDPFQRAIIKLYASVDLLLAHARMHEPYAVPPLSEEGEWTSFHDAFVGSRSGFPEGHPRQGGSDAFTHPTVASIVAMMTAYSESDEEAFNRAVAGYDELLRREMPGVMRRMDLEVWFNRARLFVGATAVYVLSFVLLCVSILLRLRLETSGGKSFEMAERARVSAVMLLWAAFAVHTLAIGLRIYLQGRPPVTNLYSSAVFVGWASVLFGLVLERLQPIAVGALGAAGVGFTTLIVAHNLGTDGDTMQMMQAVLDSNFWLATHVITITLGYSATFLAGALGIVYIVLGVFTRRLTRERAQALTRMVYGIVCFGLLLSFIGTVLGGIWADQSWGRFWGWDPKENGAALIVLNAAIILHARWGGMIRQRGIMVLAVGGNIVTAWSWFGTNMLGVGLHSYGFMEGQLFWMLLFVVSQLLIMGLGLLPHAAWKSHHRLTGRGRDLDTPGDPA